MDERDHILIRISLELDKMPKPQDAINALHGQLRNVEKRIEAFERQARQHSSDGYETDQ